MLLLADFLSVSPQLPAELKACLQPAAFALIDALTPFEVRVVVDVDGDTTISGCFGSAAWRFVVDWLIHGTDQSVHPPPQIQHMHAALLDAAGQALLKKLHGDYQQRYKYRGRV